MTTVPWARKTCPAPAAGLFRYISLAVAGSRQTPPAAALPSGGDLGALKPLVSLDLPVDGGPTVRDDFVSIERRNLSVLRSRRVGAEARERRKATAIARIFAPVLRSSTGHRAKKCDNYYMLRKHVFRRLDAGRVDDALLDITASVEVSAQAGAWDLVLWHLAHKGQTRRAFKVFKMMKERGIETTAGTFAALLESLRGSKSQEIDEKNLSVLNESEKRGKLNPHVFNSYVKQLVERREWEEIANSVLGDVPKGPIDAATFTIIAHAFVYYADTQKTLASNLAHTLLEAVVKHTADSKKPGVVLDADLLSALCNLGRVIENPQYAAIPLHLFARSFPDKHKVGCSKRSSLEQLLPKLPISIANAGQNKKAHLSSRKSATGTVKDANWLLILGSKIDRDRHYHHQKRKSNGISTSSEQGSYESANTGDALVAEVLYDMQPKLDGQSFELLADAQLRCGQGARVVDEYLKTWLPEKSRDGLPDTSARSIAVYDVGAAGYSTLFSAVADSFEGWIANLTQMHNQTRAWAVDRICGHVSAMLDDNDAAKTMAGYNGHGRAANNNTHLRGRLRLAPLMRQNDAEALAMRLEQP